jgi:CheY-like chemotaxis protein
VSAFELDEIQSQVVAEDTNNKSKALVVDDNLPSQKLAISLLKSNGYAVDAVSSGNQAIARSRNTAYQVILMDLNMQDGNGFAATKTLREQGCKAHIIALTADKSLKQKSLDLGANDFIVKPLRPEMLKQALQGKATANTTQKTLALPSPSNTTKTSREWAEF